MYDSVRRNPAFALLCALIVGILALCVEAQVQTVPGKGKPKAAWSSSTIIALAGNNSAAELYTVPQNRVLVVTDLVASNNTGIAAYIRLLGGGDLRFGTILVPTNGTIDHTFGSGIEFAAGEAVTVTNPGATGSGLLWSLHGYLRKD